MPKLMGTMAPSKAAGAGKMCWNPNISESSLIVAKGKH